jgi:hypothetical protein
VSADIIVPFVVVGLLELVAENFFPIKSIVVPTYNLVITVKDVTF